MTKALNIIIDQEFISQYDEDEVKTTWILRSLTGFEYLNCCSSGFVDDVKFINYGLVGWKNFVNDDGSEIEFSKEQIGRIPPHILQDISYHVQKISANSEDEIKNS